MDSYDIQGTGKRFRVCQRVGPFYIWSLEMQKTEDVSSSLRSGSSRPTLNWYCILTGTKEQCPGQAVRQTGRQRFSSLRAFILIMPSTDCIRFIHTRESDMHSSCAEILILPPKFHLDISRKKCLVKFLSTMWPSPIGTYSQTSQNIF